MIPSIGMTRIPLTARFGELLIEKGLATPEQVSQALSRQRFLRMQNQHIRIGDLLQKECDIDRRTMEDIFIKELFHQVLLRLKILLAEDPDLPSNLECVLITIRILQEEPNILLGEADMQVSLPDRPENILMICIPFDFRFSDYSTIIDLPDTIDQIKNGLNETLAISPSEQRSMGIAIQSMNCIFPLAGGDSLTKESDFFEDKKNND